MRYLEKFILEDLNNGKMVFVGGARQVGKTTLAKQIGEKYFEKFTYLNWDNVEHRKRILNAEYDYDSHLIIFDEIHKFSKWKSFVKGEYDVKKEKYKFLITGSARLDVYKKGGDSLVGRYFYYKLHPFSLAEILGVSNDFSAGIYLNFKENFYFSHLDDLITYGGFPEPFLKQDKRFLLRRSKNRLKRIVYEDIRDLSNLKDIGLLELLVNTLPSKVGSKLSINSLAEDLQVSNKTVANWIQILENVYICYRVYPYHKNNLRAIKKEPKLYLWDFTNITDLGVRYENLIANHLLKRVNFLEDVYGYDVGLYYLRDKEKREVDFVITFDKQVYYLIEVKSSDSKLSKSLFYYHNLLKPKFSFQVVFGNKEIDIEKEGIRIISASKFLTALV